MLRITSSLVHLRVISHVLKLGQASADSFPLSVYITIYLFEVLHINQSAASLVSMVVAGWISDMPICTLHARTHQLVRWDKQETTGVCKCMHAILDLQQDACNSDIRTATYQSACNSDMHTRRAVLARTHACPSSSQAFPATASTSNLQMGLGSTAPRARRAGTAAAAALSSLSRRGAVRLCLCAPTPHTSLSSGPCLQPRLASSH